LVTPLTTALAVFERFHTKVCMKSQRSALKTGSWVAGMACAALAAYVYLRPSATPTVAAAPQPVSAQAAPMVQSELAPAAPSRAAVSTPTVRPVSSTQAEPSMPPSFDCATATVAAERLVCASPQMAVVDLSMVNAYREALARKPERAAELRAAHNAWLQDRRNACVDALCVQRAYEERLRELIAH
jgi:uncharacterized protein YecT (DUF1311 family)